jgi:hypothetical protein
MPAPASLWTELTAAAQSDPFLVVATGVFALAVLHAFAAPIFARAAHRLESAHAARVAVGAAPVNERGESSDFRAALLHLLGEVEAVFGLWALVLFALLIAWPGKGWDFACRYVESGDYAYALGAAAAAPSKFVEPLFVFVIMALASARPVVNLAGRALGATARLFGGSPAAHWLTLLTLAPLLGSLITEPAAMTIAAWLLSRQFFVLRPSESLKYATLALLFVNISVGGALTHFAAPPIVLGAGGWGGGRADVFRQFAPGVLATILLSNTLYFLYFRKELAALRPEGAPASPEPVVPFWVTGAHLLFMVWTVAMLAGHHPILMLGGLLAFLAFTVATPQWQSPLRLRGPLLVGFFLAGLVVLGGLQGWWIGPVLLRLGDQALLVAATVLTSFNDNAAITYLAAQVPALAAPGGAADALRHAVVAGALAGGGLTVIANAPNPAGQSILSHHFDGAVSARKLALWALLPTLLAVLCLGFLRG